MFLLVSVWHCLKTINFSTNLVRLKLETVLRDLHELTLHAIMKIRTTVILLLVHLKGQLLSQDSSTEKLHSILEKNVLGHHSKGHYTNYAISSLLIFPQQHFGFVLRCDDEKAKEVVYNPITDGITEILINMFTA